MGFASLLPDAKNSLHGSDVTATPLRRRPRLPSTAIQIVQEVDQSGGPLLMQGVAHVVAVAVEANLGRDEEHLEPGDADGVIGHRDLLQLGDRCVLVLVPFGMARHQLHPAPQGVGQHHNLEEGMMGLKALGGNRQHAFPLGFPDEILHVRPLIVGVNDPMRTCAFVGHEHAIDVVLGVQQLQLPIPHLLLPNPHDDEAAGLLPAPRLIPALVVLVLPVPRPPGFGKGRIAPLVAEGEPKPLLQTGVHALPADELPVPAHMHFLHRLGQLLAKLPDLPGHLFGADCLAPSLRPAQVFAGLLQKAPHGPQACLAAMLRVVALARPLDRPVHRGHGRVDIHRHPSRRICAQRPYPRPHGRPQAQQRGRLHHPQRGQIPPERTDRRQPADAQHAADHGVGAHIGEVPQPLKPNEQQQQHPQDHPIPAQLRLPFRMHVVRLKRVLEADQVQELHQRQQPAERPQSLRTLAVRRVRRDRRLPPLVRLARPVSPLSTIPFSVRLARNHLGDLLVG